MVLLRDMAVSLTHCWKNYIKDYRLKTIVLDTSKRQGRNKNEKSSIFLNADNLNVGVTPAACGFEGQIGFYEQSTKIKWTKVQGFITNVGISFARFFFPGRHTTTSSPGCRGSLFFLELPPLNWLLPKASVKCLPNLGENNFSKGIFAKVNITRAEFELDSPISFLYSLTATLHALSTSTAKPSSILNYWRHINPDATIGTRNCQSQLNNPNSKVCMLMWGGVYNFTAINKTAFRWPPLTWEVYFSHWNL